MGILISYYSLSSVLGAGVTAWAEMCCASDLSEKAWGRPIHKNKIHYYQMQIINTFGEQSLFSHQVTFQTWWVWWVSGCAPFLSLFFFPYLDFSPPPPHLVPLTTSCKVTIILNYRRSQAHAQTQWFLLVFRGGGSVLRILSTKSVTQAPFSCQ